MSSRRCRIWLFVSSKFDYTGGLGCEGGEQAQEAAPVEAAWGWQILSFVVFQQTGEVHSFSHSIAWNMTTIRFCCASFPWSVCSATRYCHSRQRKPYFSFAYLCSDHRAPNICVLFDSFCDVLMPFGRRCFWNWCRLNRLDGATNAREAPHVFQTAIESVHPAYRRSSFVSTRPNFLDR